MPVVAAPLRWHPEATWLPVIDSIAVRISQALALSEDDRVAIKNVVAGMVAEPAVVTVADDILERALQHIADREFTIVPELPARRPA